jgi:hypothetical protein
MDLRSFLEVEDWIAGGGQNFHTFMIFEKLMAGLLTCMRGFLWPAQNLGG